MLIVCKIVELRIIIITRRYKKIIIVIYDHTNSIQCILYTQYDQLFILYLKQDTNTFYNLY